MIPQRVTVQIRRPTDTDLGQVTEGFYIIDGGMLTMTDAAGAPVTLGEGSKPRFTHRLLPGDNPEAIARVLTKKARRERLGLTEDNEAFGRRLSYGPLGVA